ncbi:hypothetical protein PC128_g14308 [Phytophthora cactorum]|nr:hypothetical protein PC128_g14308 [Phytophthora cactorum]
MADVYDRGRKDQEFQVGDRVYLSTKNLDTAHTGFPNSRKLGPKWIGSYSILRKVHNHAYEINLPPGLKLHPVFNTGSLKPYTSPNRLSRTPEVILHDGSVGKIVEAIIGKRKRLGTTQYHIRWVSEKQTTWEPLENLHQVTGLIQAYEETLTEKPRKRRRKDKEDTNIAQRTRRRIKDQV